MPKICMWHNCRKEAESMYSVAINKAVAIVRTICGRGRTCSANKTRMSNSIAITVWRIEFTTLVTGLGMAITVGFMTCP